MVEEVEVGMIIVDYADRLRGGEEDRYRGMGTIYDGLIEISKKFACPVWTGTQVRKFNAMDQTIDMTGVAESWKKVESCDIMVSLNQTNNEYNHGVARLNFTKIRDGEARKVIPVVFQQSHCLLRELNEQERKDMDVRAMSVKEEPGTNFSTDPGKNRVKPVQRMDTNSLDAMGEEREEADERVKKEDAALRKSAKEVAEVAAQEVEAEDATWNAGYTSDEADEEAALHAEHE